MGQERIKKDTNLSKKKMKKINDRKNHITKRERYSSRASAVPAIVKMGRKKKRLE